MTITFRIRPLRRSDLPELADMIADLAQHHGDNADISPAKLTRDAIGPRRLFTVTLAARAGHPVGYAATLPLGLLQWGWRGLDLHHLYVRPEARGLGAGRALVTAVLDQARRQGCTYVSVGAAAGNIAAQGFYRSLGFADHAPAGAQFRLALPAAIRA